MTTPAFFLSLAAALVQPADTLRLGDVRAAAVHRDPRQVQASIIYDNAQRRLDNLRTERLPALSITGQATLQDDVISLPIVLPGVDVPSPPHEQYRVQLEAEQLLYDGGRLARRGEIELARRAEALAGVGATLHATREAATDAFFAVLLSRARVESLDLGVRDIEAHLDVVRARAAAGAALRAEVAQAEAEAIRITQLRDEAVAAHRTALLILASFIGRPVTTSDVLLLPDDGGAMPPAGEPRRPELERLVHARERAIAESRLAGAATLPDVRLFGQAGVGRPDPFVPFDDGTDTFGIVGVRLRWNLFDWGRARREAQIAQSQGAVADLDREALRLALERTATREQIEIERLEAALSGDEHAVMAREEVLRVTRRQFEEGVLLISDYVDRLTDYLDARLTRDRHRIEAAHARARLLSTLGRFPGEEAPVTP